MPEFVLPSSQYGRSATAVGGKSDITDQNVYSSIVLQHGGAGNTVFFNTPRGQTIPKVYGGITASAVAHHTTYSELTTNITKAGEFGGGLGDGSIRNISAHAEQAASTPATGVARAYGATQFEIADLLSKASVEFRVGGKRQINGPVFMFPDMGGMEAVIANSATTSTVIASVARIGGKVRSLKLAIPVARNDTLEGELRIAAGTALAHHVTGAQEQAAYLLWFVAHAVVKGDVR